MQILKMCKIVGALLFIAKLCCDLSRWARPLTTQITTKNVNQIIDHICRTNQGVGTRIHRIIDIQIMDKEYVDIVTREFCRQFRFLIQTLVIGQ